MVTVWIPKHLKDVLDAEVQKRDSDRSKVMREALRRAFDTAHTAA